MKIVCRPNGAWQCAAIHRLMVYISSCFLLYDICLLFVYSSLAERLAEHNKPSDRRSSKPISLRQRPFRLRGYLAKWDKVIQSVTAVALILNPSTR
ncbi:hypothetical protein J6590_006504 [Homalodisca vitripennis]|nr:hypothetical protein J6590_006504 [Homalodisca vitripennis]